MTSKIMFSLILTLWASLISCTAGASPDKVFICMKTGHNTAISADGDGVLEYIDMTDSNGAKVVPQDTVDGNSYLPFRFICELMGFTDDDFNADGKSFRYTARDPEVWNSRDKIEIYSNGNYVCHEVGAEFSYEASPGDIRNVCIYNINGSLYFPMTYMAKLTGGSTFWCEKTKEIIFATAGTDIGMYMDEYARIRDTALNQAMYYPIFDYNRQNGCYIASDGVTVANSGEVAANIYRIKNTLIFLDTTGEIMTKSETTGTRSALKITDTSGNPVSVLAEDFVIVRNKLYGIDAANSRLFRCSTDGKDFTYITDAGVSNLYARIYNSSYFLYYCDRQSKAEIHMLDLDNTDNYIIEITDIYHNSLLYDIVSYSVTDKQFVYTDSAGRKHTIYLPDPLEEFEIARIADWQYKVTPF